MGTRGFIRAAAAVAAGLLAVTAFGPGVAQAAEPDTGVVTGRLAKSGAGTATVNLFTTAGASAGQVTSDADGRYTFPAVTPGSYKVQFGFGGRWQWAYQQLGFTRAAVVEVASGGTAVVDDTMLDPGRVEIVATDAVTGAPVNEICASQWEHIETDCGATGGVLKLSNLSDGTYTLYLTSSDGLHARTTLEDVTVAFGKVTRIEVALTPTSAITTTVRDRATGEPVADVCVAALPLVFGAIDDDTCDWSRNYTDEQGRVTLEELTPGEYTLIAAPMRNDALGLQWVGKKGGTGSQYKALRINAGAGALSTVPDVLLDPAASITGTIRDAETGEPMVNGCAAILPTKQGSSGFGTNCTMWDSEGRYTLSGLGPYDWPVQYSYFYDYNEPYAAYWSGGAADRKAATPIKAGVEQSTVADATLQKLGVGLTFTTRTPDGQPYGRQLEAEVYNARTGDYVKSLSYAASLDGLVAQPTRIKYWTYDPYRLAWYGGTNFATADNVRADPAKPGKVKITVPFGD
jgi:hypothetical protein